MADASKHIHLFGIERREAMLIQSFIDLVNEDLGLTYVDDAELEHKPDLFIVDELSHHDSINKSNPTAPVLVVGPDLNNREMGYLHRPLQWSRFKSVLGLLNQNTSGSIGPDLTQIMEIDGADEDQAGAKSFRADSASQNVTATGAEQEKTNKEKVNEVSSVEAPNAIALVASDIANIADVTEEQVTVDNFELSEKDVALAAHFEGLDRLGANIEFWGEEDCQVIVGGKSTLFVLPKKGMVYSEYPAVDWELLLRAREARKAFLPTEWQPSGRMKSYPLRWLTWYSGHARSKGYLLNELNKDHYFLLNKWPEFDLLYTNNEHLKLCGLMFKEGHSIQEMVSKTHLRARVIIGLINSCHKLGILSSFPDKDSARPRINEASIDNHTVMSLLSKVFKN